MGTFAQQAADIVAGLDLDTKIKLLSGDGFWWLHKLDGYDQVQVSDGPHGLRQQLQAGDHLGVAGAQRSTCFPTASTLGSSWDVELAAAVGNAIGEEAVEQGVSVVLGPGINIKRHPSGGRNFEYLSEDPFLTGTIAAAYINGLQSNGVGTSLKHFAVNNQESYRLVVDAVVDERTLREIYLTGFEIAVRNAQPWTVMSSYNQINGTYAAERRDLITTTLRDEWGFEGLVVTDWGGTSDRIAGINAGTDLEMPGAKGAFNEAIAEALENGTLSEEAFTTSVTRVVELILRSQRSDRPASDRDAHHATARAAAAAGTVLLTNDGILPLTPQGRIAVIGGFAASPRFQGAGSSQVTPTRLDNALDALNERVGSAATVTYVEGFDAKSGVSSLDQRNDAIAAATEADVAVIFAGLPARYESEGFDRATLDLPEDINALIEAVATTGTPVVVMLNNGGVVSLPWADRVNAIVECWLGGQAGGPAMVDVLFGDVEPGGRLAETMPHHLAQLPADQNFPGDPRQVLYAEGHNIGYRFFDRSPVGPQFPFGHGLSYTSFSWSEPVVSGDGVDRVVTLTVTNVGDRAGSDVVQVYVRDPKSTLKRPDKELKGFAKVHLAPGESTDVQIPLDRRSFAVWDVSAHDWLVEDGEFEIVVARSAADEHAAISITIDSDDVIGAVSEPAGMVATKAEFVALLGHDLPPIPQARPFHRNSTLLELGGTKTGDLLIKGVLTEGVRQATKEFPDPDEATVAMIESALKEGPLRGLVLMGGGAISFEVLDGIIDGLNKDWAALGGRVKNAIKK